MSPSRVLDPACSLSFCVRHCPARVRFARDARLLGSQLSTIKPKLHFVGTKDSSTLGKAACERSSTRQATTSRPTTSSSSSTCTRRCEVPEVGRFSTEWWCTLETKIISVCPGSACALRVVFRRAAFD